MNVWDFFRSVIVIGGMLGVAIIFYFLFLRIFVNKDILAQLSEKNRFTMLIIVLISFSLLIFYVLIEWKHTNTDNKENCKILTNRLNDKIKSIDLCSNLIKSKLQKKNSINRIILETDTAFLVICRNKMTDYLTYQCNSLLTKSVTGKLEIDECDAILKNYH